MTDGPEGPPEPDTFHCGLCGLPVVTYWAPGHMGLLRGDYDLLGDVILHKECTEVYLSEFQKA